MGSASDLPIMEKAPEMLDKLGIPYEVKVLSAHRTPDDTRKYARAAFEAIFARNPDDIAAQRLGARAKDLETRGVPEDWDGIEILSRK